MLHTDHRLQLCKAAADRLVAFELLVEQHIAPGQQAIDCLVERNPAPAERMAWLSW